jgi:hypothetical protein
MVPVEQMKGEMEGGRGPLLWHLPTNFSRT